jgi:hypothetical protein
LNTLVEVDNEAYIQVNDTTETYASWIKSGDLLSKALKQDIQDDDKRLSLVLRYRASSSSEESIISSRRSTISSSSSRGIPTKQSGSLL